MAVSKQRGRPAGSKNRKTKASERAVKRILNKIDPLEGLAQLSEQIKPLIKEGKDKINYLNALIKTYEILARYKYPMFKAIDYTDVEEAEEVLEINVFSREEKRKEEDS